MNTRPDPSIPLANQYSLVLVADGFVSTGTDPDEPVDEPVDESTTDGES